MIVQVGDVIIERFEWFWDNREIWTDGEPCPRSTICRLGRDLTATLSERGKATHWSSRLSVLTTVCGSTRSVFRSARRQS